ncbi:MAG: sodium/proline symporter PutP [Varibaculum sp.]|nr:sodium/proline symporter PutP [Varibaculum sp.]
MSHISGIAIAMIIYFVAMIIIGIYGYTRTKTLDDYMLGGRNLPPFVAALSAGAADMSGWLLLGLPGAMYAAGIFEAWIAIGLTIGAWINWLVVAPRLRAYTEVAGDSITVPSFFSNRTRDEKKVIRYIAGIIIVVFFTLYVSSGMVSGGKFFNSTFGWDYRVGMVFVAGVVILYTLVGGFLAVSWTDTVQGLMMLVALIAVPIVGLVLVGGFGGLTESLNATGDSSLLNPLGKGLDFEGWMGFISNIAWGLGYFGMPHIIVRFMALRTPGQAKSARRFWSGWMVFSLLGAVFVALTGRALSQQGRLASLMPDDGGDPETVFLVMGEKLFPAFLAGFMLAAILAAIMSTVSSQLLVTSSAMVEDIYHGATKKELSDDKGVLLGRVTVLLVSVVAALLALNPENSVLELVSFAWAGFGAAFGPIVILALYWKKLSWQGTAAGMAVGAVLTFLWKYAFNSGDDSWIVNTYLYEIVPGFVMCLLVAWLVSKATWRDNPEIMEEFDRAVAISKGLPDPAGIIETAEEKLAAAAGAKTE